MCVNVSQIDSMRSHWAYKCREHVEHLALCILAGRVLLSFQCDSTLASCTFVGNHTDMYANQLTNLSADAWTAAMSTTSLTISTYVPETPGYLWGKWYVSGFETHIES